MPAEREIIVFEPRHTGHRLQYVANVVGAFAGKRRIVVCTHRDTLASQEFDTLLKPLEASFDTYILEDAQPAKKWSKPKHSWIFLKLCRKHRTAEFFIPYLDYIFYHFGFLSMLLRCGGGVSGILFRGDYAYDLPDTWIMKLKQRVAHSIVSSPAFAKIFVMDELVFNHFEKNGLNARKNVISCPDPVDMEFPHADTDSARAALGLPRDAKIIGTLGVLDGRKGIDLLIDAFQDACTAEDEYLLLVGKQTAEIRDQLNEVRGTAPELAKKIIEVDRFVSQDEFLGYLQAMDTVWVVYRNHVGPASIFVRAAVANKQIIASDFGWIGHMARKTRRVIAVNTQDLLGIRSAIKHSFSENPLTDASVPEHFRDYTVLNMQGIIRDSLEDHLSSDDGVN